MVAAHDVGVYLGTDELGCKTLGTEPVVDAPAGILLAGMEAVAPPRIDVGGVGEEVAESVDETALEQVGELGTFLVGETGVVAVALRILDVDLFVCHVHVATHEDGFPLVECLQIATEGIIPRHALVEPLEPILGVGRIDGDDEEVGVFEGDDTSLGVHVEPAVVGHGRDDFIGQTEGDGLGCVLGVDGSA